MSSNMRRSEGGDNWNTIGEQAHIYQVHLEGKTVLVIDNGKAFNPLTYVITSFADKMV